MIDALCCSDQGGVPQGPGVACGSMGACCLDADSDGISETCTQMDSLCCASVGGTFQGVGSVCLGVGACCFPGAAGGTLCATMNELCCDDVAGTFLGNGTICLGDANMNGIDDACEPQVCGPTAAGTACLPVVCPTPGEECLPTCMSFSQGVFTVLDCTCRNPLDCHIEFDPAVGPICVGDCPPGQVCDQTIITTPTGFDICCECVPSPQDCQPTPDGLACEPFACPIAGQTCVPRCVREDPATGLITVLDCDCRDPGACQAIINTGVPPFCEGNCPPGMICVTNQVVNADGTIDTCCDCVLPPCDCPGDINGDGVLNGLDIAGFVRCLLGVPLAVDNCGCADINGDGLVDPNDIAGFVQRVLNKAPCGPTPCCPEEDLAIPSLATGVSDVDGTLISIGGDDDTWIVTVDPSGGVVPRPATVITPNSAWLTIPGTQWISAAATGPNGFYTYQYCFCLDPRFTNAQLILDLRADDNAEVYLNGTLVGATPVTSFNTALPTHIDVTNQALFLAGENCIEVVVRNQFGVVTGLNLEGSITATSGKCCCPPRDLLDSADSGVDDVGNLIPVGNDDADWQVTVDPSGGIVPRPATVITPNSAWLTIPGTQWISAAATGPNGFYTYKHTFCLDPRFKNPLMILDLRADDNATVWLNGNLIGSTPNPSFNTALPTHIVVNNPVLFKPCDNCLEVIVRNQFGVVTGLNIAALITAVDGQCCDPVCGPQADQLACQPVQCPAVGEECVPRCVQVNPGAGTTIILDCDCRGPNDCQVDPTAAPGVIPACINACPPGFNCVQTIVQNGDLIDVCCDCEPIDLLGACCVTTDPDCFVTTAADCAQQGGQYLGDGTVCGGQQACCLADGTCIDADVSCCQLLHGGTPQGAGTACLGDLDGNGIDEACEPPPQLSCCDANGLCFDLLPGTTQCPPGTTLVNGPCGLIQACCFPDGTCMDTYVPCCMDLGGAPQGPGSDCTTVNCPPPPGCGKDPLTGFCVPVTCPIAGEECLPTCIEFDPNTGVFSALNCMCQSPNLCHIELLLPPLSGFECVGGCPPGQQCVTTVTVDPVTGIETICCECQDVPPPGFCCDLTNGNCFAAPAAGCPAGSVFNPNPCLPPQGCCLPDDTCVNIDPNCCLAIGGSVTPALCTGVIEACCLPDGSCKNMERDCCLIQMGTPTAGTLCAAPEACCLPNGACIDTDPVCCQTIGGLPQGAGTVCLGDANGNGVDDACEPPGAECPVPPPGHCLNQQTIDCQNGPPGTECLPQQVIIGPPGTPPFVEKCACFLAGEDCGPVQINGPVLSCQGICPVPPQGNQCVIHVDGVSTGLPSVDSTNLPQGSSVTCNCSP
ncbi:MAG: dockerin type I domain-containing protein [Phycisphaerae bacterium]